MNRRKEDRENKRTQTDEITYSGGNGSSLEKAIIISGSQSPAESTQAERRYLARHLGEEGSDWHLQSRTLLASDGQIIDKLIIEKASGESQIFYFEISDLFRPSG